MSKVVLVTGSSSGIGQQTAYAFARNGWSVIVTYRSEKKEGEETAEECLKLGAKSVLLLQLDILKDSSILSAVKKIKSKYGKIDCLVNNAGILVKKPLLKQTFKDIEMQVRTNLESLMKVTLATLPIVKKTIVNIASRRGFFAIPEAPVYGGAKWGVRGFTKSLALEHKNLYIVAVNPTLTATRMTKYKGYAPEKVASVVLNAAEGKYKKVKSGGDLNIWEIYGIKPY